MEDRGYVSQASEQRTFAGAEAVAKAADRPTAPVDEALQILERDAVALTQLVDQLDERLAAVMGDGNPHPDTPSDPAPGTCQLVTGLMMLHARLSHDLARLDRMTRRLEVG